MSPNDDESEDIIERNKSQDFKTTLNKYHWIYINTKITFYL